MDEILGSSLLGWWTAPEINDTKIEGTLFCDGNGVYVLKTMNPFGGLESINIDRLNYIIGFTENGKKITLLDCSTPNKKINMPGFITCEYSSTYIVIGAQYHGTHELICKNVSAEYYGLETWLDIKPFECYNIPDTLETYVKYNMPKTQTWDIGEQSISFSFKMNIKSNTYSNFALTQSQRVAFSTKSCISFEELFDLVYDFASFLTLCMGRHELPQLIQATDINGNDIQLIENIPITLPLNEKLKPILFITFSDLQDNFKDCMEKWKAKKELLMPVIQRFVESHEPTHNIITSFLNIVQALETFSRRTRRETLLPEDEYKTKLLRILNKIEYKEDKDWLSDVFETPVLNEPSFQSRITKLLKETAFAFNISKSKISGLAYSIVNTRNYYTHFNEAIKSKILSDSDVFYCITLIKYVIRVLLMKELGLSNDHIKGRIEDDTEISFALGKLRLKPEMKLFDMRIVPIEGHSKEQRDEPH